MEDGALEVGVIAAPAFALQAVHPAECQLAIDAVQLAGRQLAAQIGKQRAGAVGLQVGRVAHDVGRTVDDKAPLLLAGAKQQLPGVQAQLALQTAMLHRIGLGFFAEQLATGK
ncbi:hypothetical protein FQZ97_1120120 [compost metagenome]